MPPRKRPPLQVCEPIQVYLTQEERRLLDQVAESTGLSRAEVLRRGVRSLAAGLRGQKSPMLELMARLSQESWPAGIAERHDELLAQEYLENFPPEPDQ